MKIKYMTYWSNIEWHDSKYWRKIGAHASHMYLMSSNHRQTGGMGIHKGWFLGIQIRHNWQVMQRYMVAKIGLKGCTPPVWKSVPNNDTFWNICHKLTINVSLELTLRISKGPKVFGFSLPLISFSYFRICDQSGSCSECFC